LGPGPVPVVAAAVVGAGCVVYTMVTGAPVEADEK